MEEYNSQISHLQNIVKIFCFHLGKGALAFVRVHFACTKRMILKRKTYPICVFMQLTRRKKNSQRVDKRRKVAGHLPTWIILSQSSAIFSFTSSPFAGLCKFATESCWVYSWRIQVSHLIKMERRSNLECLQRDFFDLLVTWRSSSSGMVPVRTWISVLLMFRRLLLCADKYLEPT